MRYLSSDAVEIIFVMFAVFGFYSALYEIRTMLKKILLRLNRKRKDKDS